MKSEVGLRIGLTVLVNLTFEMFIQGDLKMHSPTPDQLVLILLPYVFSVAFVLAAIYTWRAVARAVRSLLHDRGNLAGCEHSACSRCGGGQCVAAGDVVCRCGDADRPMAAVRVDTDYVGLGNRLGLCRVRDHGRSAPAADDAGRDHDYRWCSLWPLGAGDPRHSPPASRSIADLPHGCRA